jgi:hypothetical protein
MVAYALTVVSGVFLLLGLFASLNLALFADVALPAAIVCGLSTIVGAVVTRGSKGWRIVSGVAGALLIGFVLSGVALHGLRATVAEHPNADGTTTVIVKQGKNTDADKYFVYLSSGSGLGRRQRLTLDVSAGTPPAVGWLDDSHLQVTSGDGRAVLAVGDDHVSATVLTCQDEHTGICAHLR